MQNNLVKKMTIEEIIKENERRLAEANASYDPKAGETPDRFVRCCRDFPYWAATCCTIKNKRGGADIFFTLNRPQRKLVAILEEMRLAGKPIRLILLKARQWGGSTCIQLYMAWLQLTQRMGLNSLIIAQQHSATAEIKDMFMRMITDYPEEMLSAIGNGDKEPSGEDCQDDNRGSGKSKKRKRIESAGPGTIRVKAGNFKVKVGSAERPHSCRSGDYSLVHCSEVALWPNTRLRTPEDMFRSATSGVLYEPLTRIALESTANGTENFFHNEYEAARSGDSQFRPLFIPWFEIEQYSLPFSDEEKRAEFAAKILSGKDNDQPAGTREQPGAYLWWLWEKGATLEAINWYVAERRKYSDHGQMAAEYPSDDVEAFVHSGATVFDCYRVNALRATCNEPFRRGEICGDAVSGPHSIRNTRFVEDTNGSLKLWKERNHASEPDMRITDRYLVVVDIGGRSAKADWSVIAVFDRAPMTEGKGPEIVAQWRGHTDFDLLAWNSARIAAYYDNALLVIESNTLETRDRERIVEGDQSNFLLARIKSAYDNLYARKSSPQEIREGDPVKYGFHTNVATKPMIISNLVQAVREGLYTEHDPACLDEYLAYEQRQDGSYGAVSGKHDDILMTRAIGLHICFNEMDLPRKIMKATGYSPYRIRTSGSAAFF